MAGQINVHSISLAQFNALTRTSCSTDGVLSAHQSSADKMPSISERHKLEPELSSEVGPKGDTREKLVDRDVVQVPVGWKGGMLGFLMKKKVSKLPAPLVPAYSSHIFTAQAILASTAAVQTMSSLTASQRPSFPLPTAEADHGVNSLLLDYQQCVLENFEGGHEREKIQVDLATTLYKLIEGNRGIIDDLKVIVIFLQSPKFSVACKANAIRILVSAQNSEHVLRVHHFLDPSLKHKMRIREVLRELADESVSEGGMKRIREKQREINARIRDSKHGEMIYLSIRSHIAHADVSDRLACFNKDNLLNLQGAKIMFALDKLQAKILEGWQLSAKYRRSFEAYIREVGGEFRRCFNEEGAPTIHCMAILYRLFHSGIAEKVDGERSEKSAAVFSASARQGLQMGSEIITQVAISRPSELRTTSYFASLATAFIRASDKLARTERVASGSASAGIALKTEASWIREVVNEGINNGVEGDLERVLTYLNDIGIPPLKKREAFTLLEESKGSAKEIRGVLQKLEISADSVTGTLALKDTLKEELEKAFSECFEKFHELRASSPLIGKNFPSEFLELINLGKSAMKAGILQKVRLAVDEGCEADLRLILAYLKNDSIALQSKLNVLSQLESGTSLSEIIYKFIKKSSPDTTPKHLSEDCSDTEDAAVAQRMRTYIPSPFSLGAGSVS